MRPPPGVDAGAFYDLVQSRGSFLDNLLSIDKAANNTSLVFCLHWRGWRLLFTGDAEQRSWRQMKKAGKLGEVDFLKVAHHGSKTGNPPPDLLQELLPGAATGAASDKARWAVVSTFTDEKGRPYHGVPDPDTEKALQQHANVCTTFDPAVRLYLEISFPPDRGEVSVMKD